MGPGNDHGLADGPHPQNPVAAETIAQNDIIFIPVGGLVDLFLDRGRHLLGGAVEGLLQEDEGHPFLLEIEEAHPS